MVLEKKPKALGTVLTNNSNEYCLLSKIQWFGKNPALFNYNAENVSESYYSIGFHRFLRLFCFEIRRERKVGIFSGASIYTSIIGAIFCVDIRNKRGVLVEFVNFGCFYGLESRL